MSNQIRVLANKSTVALYILGRQIGVSYDQMICLYEIYKEDVFYFFHVLEGKKISFENGNKYFPEEAVFEKVFTRANNILHALQGIESNIRRYDMKYYRELEKMYRNGQLYWEVEC